MRSSSRSARLVRGVVVFLGLSVSIASAAALPSLPPNLPASDRARLERVA